MNIQAKTTANQDKVTAAMTIKAALAATRKIAPLWPLKHFVAVNPFLGLADKSFASAAQVMARNAGASMTMDRAYYAAMIASGRITDADLTEALHDASGTPGLPGTVEALKAAAKAPGAAKTALKTVATAVSVPTETDWARFVTERMTHWAAAHFDEGQAAWRSPWQEDGPWIAWRGHASISRAADWAGLDGFRAFVAGLPEDAEDAIVHCAALLGIPEDGQQAYFHRLLMDAGGWSAYVRYLVWETELYGGEDDRLVQFLAIRLAWDAGLAHCLGKDPDVAAAWEKSARAYGGIGETDPDVAIDCVLQAAFDKAWQRELLDRMAAPAPVKQQGRKAVQAAFCIDVRSEVFRRALENTSADIETIGFAGFFGYAIEYVPLGKAEGGAQCPVLLTPQFTVKEQVRDVTSDEETEILGLRLLRRRAGKAWKSFKLAAVSSFGFVETMGLTYSAKLVTDALGITRTVPHPDIDGIDDDVRERLGPRVTYADIDGNVTGFADQTRIDTAEGMLKAMSMTGDFARIVLLAGHGSTTVNNPHASGLDCGACGGHTGEANARVAVAILNDPVVRAGLKTRGVAVPDDTIFIAGLHDTTTDEVSLYETASAPASHADDLAQLREWLAQAARATRAERAGLLHLKAGKPVDAEVLHRSRDWSQVRPEWGLAGCAAFIAAPRARTEGRDLAGRSFLHNYDWQADDGFGVLELIMTAPMVVASWISLQYFGSTVDNRAFGSGNKVLHNVVGTIGVLEGNGGDLRTGLPLQSIHDGDKLVHEPLRLNVMIEAPIEAMNAIIEKHEAVRDLLDNGWLFLFAIDQTGAVSHRYDGDLKWKPLADADSQRQAA